MSPTSKTVLIAGYYGFDNLGDEAILKAILSSLRALRSDLEFVVVSGAPQQTEAKYHVRSILWTDVSGILEAAAKCDLILVGGGGIFLDYWGVKPHYLLTENHAGNSFFAGFPLLARLNHKPCMIYSVGVGPLLSEDGKMLTRVAFELADIATVRDIESRDLLSLIGVCKDKVVVAADPAFDLPADNLNAGPLLHSLGLDDNKRLVAVCLRNWDVNIKPDVWQKHVTSSLDQFIEDEGVSLIFIPFHTLAADDLTDDISAAETVLSGMKNRDFAYLIKRQLDPEEAAGVISNCEMTIGMRLHSLIFSFNHAVPAVAIAYDPKTTHTMSLMHMSGFAVDLQTLTSENLYKSIKGAWAERQQISAFLKSKVQEARASAASSARLASELLDRDFQTMTSPSSDLIEEFALKQTRLLAEFSDQKSKEYAAMASDRVKLETEIASVQTENSRLAAEYDRLAAESAVLAKDKEALTTETERLATKIDEKAADLTAATIKLEIVSAQLTVVSSELERIKRSLGWRLLSRYGKFKYRYLLPAYRFLSGSNNNVAEVKVQENPTEDEAKNRVLSTSHPDIICFPIVDWNFRFQRPQQLLSQFAGAGHRVFYVNCRFQPEPIRVHNDAFGPRIHSVELSGPESLNLYNDELDAVQLNSIINTFDVLNAEQQIDEAICLVQLPFWAPLALELRRRYGWKIVYDCMDEHTAFSTTGPRMLGHEFALISESNLVLTTSRMLYDKAAPHAEHVLLLPNAADFAHFNTPGPGDSPLANLPKPIIGYYGAISDWFDVEMIAFAALERPDWQFVLIGDTFGADVSSLKKLSNVHLLGEKSYLSLPGYLHDFDVACIPFHRNPLTEATNPVKFYEYLSAGKPVVAVNLPELEPYREYFYGVSSRQDFVKQVEAALGDNVPGKVQSRIDFARANTWQDRYGVLQDSIKEIYPKAAIIIVSFENLSYLRLCLDSIWAKTLYPNFEVVVVDNGARPDIVSYLRDVEKQESRMKLILNAENLGFARANNIGIRAADDSEFVVLLNDDTVVTRGWLGKLIRYLEHSDIGVIGPVTNWAGNEARIDVDYSDIKNMDEFARSYTFHHQRKSFDIPMLAMYCLGMRKSLVDEIGLLDEQFGIGMFEDDDFSLRVRRAGYRVVCAEDVFIHHWGRASFSKLSNSDYQGLFDENKKKFEAKWGLAWEGHKSRS